MSPIMGNNGAVISPHGGINGEINDRGGEINQDVGGGNEKSNDEKIVIAIEKHPGIKREGLLLETKIPLRTIDRILQHLRKGNNAKIEYRGSKKTGGWFIKS